MNTLKSTIKSVFVLVSALFLFLNFMPSATPVIHMIGDSTMANKDLRGGNTERGWGIMLPDRKSVD